MTHSYKAKARQREHEEQQQASTSSNVNSNNKRPLGVTPASSTSPTKLDKGKGKLQRDSRLGTYFEYDLSKMVNSKGGFLVEDGNKIDEATRQKEMEREKQRAMQNMDPRMCIRLGFVYIPIMTAVSSDIS